MNARRVTLLDILLALPPAVRTTQVERAIKLAYLSGQMDAFDMVALTLAQKSARVEFELSADELPPIFRSARAH